MPVRPWGAIQLGRDQLGSHWNTDELSLLDSLAITLNKPVEEIAALLDDLSSKLSMTPSEALGLLDTVVATRVLILPSGDSSRMWGARQWGIQPWGEAYSTDVLALADGLSVKLSKTMDEMLTILDAVALTLHISLADSLSLSDAVTLVFHLTIGESATLIESIALHSKKLIEELTTLAETVQPLLTQLPAHHDCWAPRPLISLTVGADTKYYSTEEMYVA